MNNITNKFVQVLTIVSLLTVLTCQATGVYEYDWISGKPGFSGEIFLDAPTSASAPNGGTILDVLPGSYLTTPLGNYSIFDSAFSSKTAPWTPDIVWNQTKIIEMILFFKPSTPSFYQLGSEAVAQVDVFGVTNAVDTTFINPDGSWSVYNGPNDDNTGQWLANTIPEPATFALLAFGFTALLVFRLGAKVSRTQPNKSPEPTAVGAGSSAVAVHVASRRWLSFLR
jgi:hypothetical protein